MYKNGGDGEIEPPSGKQKKINLQVYPSCFK